MEFTSLNKYLEDLRNTNVILYGAGSKGKQALELLHRYGVNPAAICDSDKNKWGKDFDGLKIEDFETARSRFADSMMVLLTVSSGFVREIKTALSGWGGGGGGIKQFCIPFKTEVDLLSDEEMASCQKELDESYSLLSDEISRRVFLQTVNYKVTGDFLPLFDYLEKTTSTLGFFDTELLPDRRDHVYVDVGAFTGDSLLSFAMAARGSYREMVAFEGDKGIYKSLVDMLTYARLPNITAENKLLYSELNEKEFYSIANNQNILFDSSNFYENTNVIFPNNKVETDSITFVTEKVYTDTLDNCLEVEPTVLKINAMGADFDILKGGHKIIKRCKPMLCLEFGVRKNDVSRLIPLIKSINSDYKFYMRVKEIYGDYKTVLYAV